MIDIFCIIIIGLFTFLGWKRGIIRSAVFLIGIFVVAIISWVCKDYLATFLMDKLPFFSFSGLFKGITAMNILVYKILAFIVLFVVLFCIVNILINISNVVEKLLRVTVIFALPSKILGAILGFVEGMVTVFLLAFCLYHFPLTSKTINNSKVAIILLERTPVIGNLAINTTLSLEDIDSILIKNDNNENKDEANFDVLRLLIKYKIISAKDAQSLIDSDKLHFGFKATVY